MHIKMSLSRNADASTQQSVFIIKNYNNHLRIFWLTRLPLFLFKLLFKNSIFWKTGNPSVISTYYYSSQGCTDGGVGASHPQYCQICNIVGQKLPRLQEGWPQYFLWSFFFSNNLVTTVGELVRTPPPKKKVSRHITDSSIKQIFEGRRILRNSFSYLYMNAYCSLLDVLPSLLLMTIAYCAAVGLGRSNQSSNYEIWKYTI